MRKVSICEKTGLKRGAWTPEEDRLLTAYIKRYGHWNWVQLPKYAGLQRCGKSCRLRWMNYLRPNISRGNYSKEEEETIIKMHRTLGNRWATIAASLPGRTDNEIKNYWHSHLKRHTKPEKENSKSKSSGIGFSQSNYDQNATSETQTSESAITTLDGERAPSRKQEVCILSFTSSDSQTSPSVFANSRSDLRDIYAPVILESSTVIYHPRSPVTYNFFS